MSNRNRSAEDATINLTPMIDVVFLLVIFFMVGSKFSESESSVKVSVSSAGPATAITRGPDDRRVDVLADGSMTLDGKTVSPEQLLAELSGQISDYPDLRVIVRAESEGSRLTFFHAVAMVQQAGVSQIKMAVQPGGDRGGRGMLR